MDIEVKDGKLFFSGKEYLCALGRGGIKINKIEGDGATPAGTFNIRRVLYRPDKISKPVTKLPAEKITPEDLWCDDPVHETYNTLVRSPHPGSFENLWREDDIYDVIVPIGYNDDPAIRGKGSAIFLHVAREGYPPTAGCIALSLSDLLEILDSINDGTKIRIE
jgi:L,D-peptidoglycan transpeptidase YkuD (ErfK/YbiS/YcfS/YnhG family)